VRRVKKVGNALIFEAQISRDSAQRRLIDDLLSIFGGRTQPVMAHLIDAGKLTLKDVQEAAHAPQLSASAKATADKERAQMTMSFCRIAAHVWQSTLFAAAIGLVTLALRRNRRGGPARAVADGVDSSFSCRLRR
jgi:hypothetical protein